MRRRLYPLACTAVLVWSGLLGAPADRARAEELGAVNAAAQIGPVAGPIDGGAPIDGAVPAGAVEGDCANGDCANGSCADGNCGHPITCLPREYQNPYLFYSFYAGGNCGSVPVGMYPSPMPTPPLVGHTYYTYQPLMPHEFMYHHSRVYHHHYNYNRGLTRTRVIWW